MKLIERLGKLWHIAEDNKMTSKPEFTLSEAAKERIRKRGEELRHRYDWWHHMNPIRRFLLRCARLFIKYNGQTQAEDTQCFIDCDCGNNMSIGDGWITWCPYCGRGYSTDFVVYCYPPTLKWKPERPEIAKQGAQMNMQEHSENN